MMDKEKLKKIQNKADIFTFICMISFGILCFLIINKPSGMEALYLIIPMTLVGLIHFVLGMAALIAAVMTRHHKRNSWIYIYFGGLVLFFIAWSGIFSSFKKTIRVKVEQVQHHKEFDLYHAIEQKNSNAVKKIINSGVDLSYCFKWNHKYRPYSPLQYSLLKGNYQICEQLLSSGINPDCSCARHGRLTLYPLALASMNLDVPMVKLLLDYGADLLSDRGAGAGIIALTIAGGGYSLPYRSTKKNKYKKKRDKVAIFEIVQLLIKAGAPINAFMQKATALHWALEFGDYDLVDYLLKAGADPNLKEKSYNRSPLILAIDFEQPELAERLIFNNPPANIDGINGLTALIEAGRLHDKITIKLLSRTGLDLRPLYGKKLKHKTMGTIDIGEELYKAVKNGDDLLVNALISAGADINRPFKSRSFGSMTIPGRFAHDLEKLKKVVALGGDVNAKNFYGSTPLHVYARCKSCIDPINAMGNLLSLGADINALDKTGETPLTKAKRYKIQDVQEFLIAHGAETEKAGLK